MGENSSIEWTHSTWNPVTGCDKVSPGCAHCYAERMAERLKAMGVFRYRKGFRLTLQADLLTLPLKWREPRLIFVNSMSDLFHEEVPFQYIKQVFEIMREARHHTFQILTKRAQRLARLAPRLVWPPNVWMGVSVESSKYTWRIAHLVPVPAALRFLSLEPLLGPLPNLALNAIGWVIVGGESGPRARPVRGEWVKEIHAQCVRAGVPFFFKQWGGPRKWVTGRVFDGRVWNEIPALACTDPTRPQTNEATVEIRSYG